MITIQLSMKDEKGLTGTYFQEVMYILLQGQQLLEKTINNNLRTVFKVSP